MQAVVTATVARTSFKMPVSQHQAELEDPLPWVLAVPT